MNRQWQEESERQLHSVEMEELVMMEDAFEEEEKSSALLSKEGQALEVMFAGEKGPQHSWFSGTLRWWIRWLRLCLLKLMHRNDWIVPIEGEGPEEEERWHGSLLALFERATHRESRLTDEKYALVVAEHRHTPWPLTWLGFSLKDHRRAIVCQYRKVLGLAFVRQQGRQLYISQYTFLSIRPGMTTLLLSVLLTSMGLTQTWKFLQQPFSWGGVVWLGGVGVGIAFSLMLVFVVLGWLAMLRDPGTLFDRDDAALTHQWVGQQLRDLLRGHLQQQGLSEQEVQEILRGSTQGTFAARGFFSNLVPPA